MRRGTPATLNTLRQCDSVIPHCTKSALAAPAHGQPLGPALHTDDNHKMKADFHARCTRSRRSDERTRPNSRSAGHRSICRSRKAISGRRSSTSASFTPRRACSLTTPASHRPQAASRKSPISTATKGVLLYRGYPIEQLAEQGDFLETCYLLLYGELPTPAQRADFEYRITRHTMVHEQMARFFQGFRRDAHPMAVMVACVGALSAFYHNSTEYLRSEAAHGRVHAAHRKAADARGDGL